MLVAYRTSRLTVIDRPVDGRYEVRNAGRAIITQGLHIDDLSEACNAIGSAAYDPRDGGAPTI